MQQKQSKSLFGQQDVQFAISQGKSFAMLVIVNYCALINVDAALGAALQVAIIFVQNATITLYKEVNSCNFLWMNYGMP